MSKTTKRKHVTKEVTEEFILPNEDLQIVKVLSGRGNNLHEVVGADSSTFLVSMPTKFRKNVWIKRGDFVMVQAIEEGDKVKAEICHILYKPQISHIIQHGLWPEAFNESIKSSEESDQMIPDDMLPPSSDDDDDDDDDTDDDNDENDDDNAPNTGSLDSDNINRVKGQQRVTFNTSKGDSGQNCNTDENRPDCNKSDLKKTVK